MNTILRMKSRLLYIPDQEANPVAVAGLVTLDVRSQNVVESGSGDGLFSAFMRDFHVSYTGATSL